MNNEVSIFEIFNLELIKNFDTELLLNSTTENNDLAEIMSKYNSDKGYGLCKQYIINNNARPPNLVCHNYTFFYEQLFSSYRNEKIKIFEMGVGVPACMGSWAGSLLGWKEYFTNSTIFSADFDKDYLYCDKRITSYYVDQENVESINNMWKNIGNHKYDFIVDDGPHTYSSNTLFYKNSINKLKTNGLYIIEDVHLDFIDKLYDDIVSYNNDNNIKFNIIKLIIPWPKNFSHPQTNYIWCMNNLIILQII